MSLNAFSIVAALCSALCAAAMAAEPAKPPPGTSAVPAPTRSVATPAPLPPAMPTQAGGAARVQTRALPPAPASAPKPDPNKRVEPATTTTPAASPPPKAADGKR